MTLIVNVDDNGVNWVKKLEMQITKYHHDYLTDNKA